MSKGKKNNRRFEEIATRVQKALLQEKGVKGLFIVVAGNGEASVAVSYPKDDDISQVSLAMGIDQGLQALERQADCEDKKASKKQPNKQKSQNKKSDDFVEDLVKMALIKAIFN